MSLIDDGQRAGHEDLAEVEAIVMARLSMYDASLADVRAELAEVRQRQDEALDYLAAMCETLASGFERLRKTS